MRKLLAVIVYTMVILLIGRNLPMLPRFTIFTNPQNAGAELKKEVEAITKDKKGNYGIYFSDLNSGVSFGSNEYEVFTAASVNKVALVTALYHLSEQGEFDLDEQITLQARDIQDYGTGSLRYEKPGSTYSYKTLAKLALKQSDNTAAFILGQKIGHDRVQAVIEKFGLTQTGISDNTTSSYDLYLLFNGIYTHKFVSEAHAKELMGYMTETDIEDRLPARLPDDAIVSHKTGDAVGFLHDVGIIRRGEDVYFISVLTSDIGTEETVTKNTIAEIGKTILSYYEKRK